MKASFHTYNSLKLICLGYLVLVSYCHSSTNPFGYNLERPSQIIDLPKELREISGLTYDTNCLYAIQDEEGDLFKIQLPEGEVTSYHFAGDGDFESIELVNDTIYVMTSKAKWYGLWFEGDSLLRRKQDRFITKDQNLEGLTYQKSTHTLLITCKGSPKDSIKQILQYDLSRKALNKSPWLTIEQHLLDDAPKYKFSPSGISIHPITGDIYILSHPKQQLLVLDSQKQVKYLTKLDLPQPEGICFDPQGVLYISSEANKTAPGRIYIYHPEK